MLTRWCDHAVADGFYFSIDGAPLEAMQAVADAINAAIIARADFPELANNADKVDAKARLMAAAPEMYAALVKARDALYSSGAVHGDATLDATDAALAKARGED